MMQTDGHFQAHVRDGGLWLLIFLVLLIYLPRLTDRPMRGEDSRRATIAYEMIDTGDWIVPRQQHVPYLSRPPLHSWVMAGFSLITGDVDYWAIRLPSVLSVLGMVVLVYFAAGNLIDRSAGFVAGLIMASFPQVIELGRTGETDPFFSFLVSASLLLWFIGYQRQWPSAWLWSAGYALAALGTLAKGIQAAPYFVASTWLFLLVRRDWRTLFSRGHLVGIFVFLLLFGAWAIPFMRALDLHGEPMGLAGLIEIFRRDSRHQWGNLSLTGFLHQLLTMPLRVGGSLFPWIFLLGLFAFQSVRQYARGLNPGFLFLCLSLVITWPTVWLSPTSQNRHFMPMYPCLAVVLSVAVMGALHSADAKQGAGKILRDFLGVMSVVVLGIGLFFAFLNWPGVTSTLGKFLPKVPWVDFRLPLSTSLFFLAGSITLAAIAQWASWKLQISRLRLGLLAIAAFLGALLVGPILSFDLARAVDVRPALAQLRQTIGAKPLVSYGESAHLFTYYFRRLIPILDFPKNAEDPSAQVEYFCFYSGSEGIADPMLPFAWEKVGQYCCDRIKSDKPRVLIVVGRKIPPSSTSPARQGQGAGL